MTTDSRPQFYAKVYFGSEQEAENIKLRAKMLKKSVSRYIRDLVVIDLHMAGLKPFIDTKEGLAHYRQTGEPLTMDKVRDDPTPEQLAAAEAEITRGLAEEQATDNISMEDLLSGKLPTTNDN